MYDNASPQFFLTNSRKLTGYFVMLVLFGLCMFMVAQELKPKPEAVFEIMDALEVRDSKNNGDVAKLVHSDDTKDKNFEQPQVANNKAQNSKGEYGHAVVEAPKGGMVNEGRVVGADEELVMDGKTKKKTQPGVNAEKVPSELDSVNSEEKSGKASRDNELAKKNVQMGEPDLLKLNEVNEKSDNVKAAKKDKVAARKGDTVGFAEDSLDEPIEPIIAKSVGDRMRKKIDNRLKGDIDDSLEIIESDTTVKKGKVGAKADQGGDDEPVQDGDDELVQDGDDEPVLDKKNKPFPKKNKPFQKKDDEPALDKKDEPTQKKNAQDKAAVKKILVETE